MPRHCFSLPDNLCIQITGVPHCSRFCNELYFSCNFHKLDWRTLVILIAFCEYARGANRLKWPCYFQRLAGCGGCLAQLSSSEQAERAALPFLFPLCSFFGSPVFVVLRQPSSQPSNPSLLPKAPSRELGPRRSLEAELKSLYVLVLWRPVYVLEPGAEIN